MAMRYIIRRPKPEDLSDIKALVPDLDKHLAKAHDGDVKVVPLAFNNMDYASFQFVVRKSATDLAWVCPTIELVAENEKALFVLTEKFKAGIPEHLKHLK